MCQFNLLVCVEHVGRASATPSIDVFITLLSLGWKGYHQLCTERKVFTLDSVRLTVTQSCSQDNYQYLVSGLEEVSTKHSEQVLRTPHNDISIGKCTLITSM